MGNVAKETLALVKAAQAKQIPDEVLKAAGFLQAGSATTGLTYYDLEAPAKTLYPVLTPLRNVTPRVVAGRGTQANWKAITGINTNAVRLGVSEGNRGGQIEHTTADYLAAFRGFGLEDFVTYEAGYAAEGFDDVRARAVEGLLRATMIGEEAIILGGNAGLALGQCGTPTVVQGTDATGTVTNVANLKVQAVALAYAAYWALGGMNNGGVGGSVGITKDPGTLTGTRTNADGSTDNVNGGTSQISAESADGITIDAGHKWATASVTPVDGAFAYAWYWGATGATRLGAITTVANVKISADGGAIAPHANLNADKSKDVLVFDGLLTQALTAGSGAYVKHFAAAQQLTTDNAGGITELSDMFQDRYDQYRLSIDELWVGSQVARDMKEIVVKNGGAPLYRVQMQNGGDQSGLQAGFGLKSILNPVTNTEVPIFTHPNMPPGAIFGRCKELPYKLSGVVDVTRMLMRQDYYQVEWPRLKRRYEYGVYFDGVLQNYFPPALVVIDNIKPGHA